jgi:hypothetical protein
MRARRTLRLGLAALIGVPPVLAGCGRKAPGPEECTRFAEMAARFGADGPWLTPEIEAQIELETQDCLTIPYDYELIQCVESTHQAHGCVESFRRRTGRSQ